MQEGIMADSPSGHSMAVSAWYDRMVNQEEVGGCQVLQDNCSGLLWRSSVVHREREKP
jgi:hypothetical protein